VPLDDDLSDQRWQGATQSRLVAVEDWVRDLDKKREGDVKGMADMRVQIAQLKTLVGVWSAVGSLLGAGIMTWIISLLGHH
jgi:hypothetical protein